ncbi:MAG TPA: lysine transporter LysE [Prolixibacteraceae bacterium]|nr:lysine transporter LysE [Prolixibacteraceae bacterium]
MLKFCQLFKLMSITAKNIYFCSMFLTLLAKGILIGLLVSIPLGPIGVLVIQRTVNKSRKAGLLSGMGAALSDTLYAIIAGFSLTFVIDFIREHEILFQSVGALVVLGLGIHIFFKNPVTDLRRNRLRGNTHFQDIISSFLVTFSNPLTVFVFLAVFTSSGVAINLEQPYHSFFVILGVFTGACLWWFSLSGIVSLFRHKINLRILWWINKTAGVVIVIFVLVTVIFTVQKNLGAI